MALIIAQEKGFLDKKKSVKVISKHLLNLWNGINITSRMKADRDTLRNMIEINLKVLD